MPPNNERHKDGASFGAVTIAVVLLLGTGYFVGRSEQLEITQRFAEEVVIAVEVNGADVAYTLECSVLPEKYSDTGYTVGLVNGEYMQSYNCEPGERPVLE